jgi:hypothetical protein
MQLTLKMKIVRQVLTKINRSITCLIIISIYTFLSPPNIYASEQLTINNGDVTITTNSDYGGGIVSLRRSGLEYVELEDHGRGIQIAWQNNNLGECWNPTEQGNRESFGTINFPNIISYTKTNQSIQAVTNPTYWIKPGEESISCHYKPDGPPWWLGGETFNTASHTNSILSRTTTLRDNTHPNIIEISGSIKFGNTDTSPQLDYIILQQPAIYLNTFFTQSYRYNYDSHSLIFSTKNNSLIYHNLHYPPVLSVLDNSNAIAIYTPQIPKEFPSSYPQQNHIGYNFHDLRGLKNSWWFAPRIPYHPQPGQTTIGQGDILTFKSYILVGTLQEVKDGLKQLIANNPPVNISCHQYAWDGLLDCPNYSISDLNQDGTVNIFDYNILVAGFGSEYDIFDYNDLVTNYGS